MSLRQKTDLTEELKIAEAKYNGSNAILGITLLTFAPYIDSARAIMFTSHIKQRSVLNHTEFPRVFGNFENIVGKYSSFDYRAKGNLVVLKIIKKFDHIDTDNQPCLVFVYDKDTDTYDVIQRKEVEDLTEKYGFAYDNKVFDSLIPGDTISKGTSLFRPTSYDEFGNYGFGQNVPFMYAVSNDTIEDAIVVSESLAEEMKSTEVELVKVSINDNDILLNIYGDNENYKCFPNIGERVKEKILCSKRRINNNQILFDLKRKNTRQILSSDKSSYIDGEIVDINVYCNKNRDEIPDAEFNHQLLSYIDMSNRYYKEIADYTDELISSGSNVSSSIRVWNKHASVLIDEDYKVKDENGSAFSNMIVYFLVKREVGLSVGQKLVGRCGNKGVISEVRPDNKMPVVNDGSPHGKRIKLIFNTLGIPNRLIIFPLYEQSITATGDIIVDKMKTLTSYKEMEEMLFGYIECFNKTQALTLRKAYHDTCKTDEDFKTFYDIVFKHGIPVHIEPFWHIDSLWDCLLKVYERFPWISPYDTFIYDEESERYIKMMNTPIIGEMYIMKLKQNSKKGLSARSTGSISKLGIPEKTDTAKKHNDPFPKTPIRFGIQEILNQLISVGPEIIAEENLLYRSSVKGRRMLATEVIKSCGGIKNVEVQLDPTVTNRNAEILNTQMMPMGLALEFSHDELDMTGDDSICSHIYKNREYLCTSDEMRDIIARDIANEQYEEEGALYIGDNTGLSAFIDELSGKIAENLEDFLGIDE